MAERFPDFKIQESQELKENSENQNSKSTWLNVWTSWDKNKNFETNLLAYEAKYLERFSIECRKTNTKVISSTNHSSCKERNEPIQIRTNSM